MPTIEENRTRWDVDYSWPTDGDEWSAHWGGSEQQWFKTVLPRIYPFLPTDTILEIAPGHGRWTQFLKNYCSRLIVVDLGSACIDSCRTRFRACTHISYHVSDGRSLGMIDDNTIDFAFSFDSLVHAESDVIDSYLAQLALKLRPNGVGFIHHSHIGAYHRLFSIINKVPRPLKQQLESIGVLPHDHWRAHSMSALRFATLCESRDLACIGQELLNWEGSPLMLDAFSLFTPRSSIWARPNQVFRNRRFMREAAYGKQLAEQYARVSFPGSSDNGSEVST